MSPRLALIALLTLPLAACEGTGLPGLGGQDEVQAEGHKGPPGVSPLEQPIETGTAEPRAVATAEAATYNTAAFSARGNEPFWAVDASGGTAIYKTPENQSGRAIRVKRIAFAEGVEYVGMLGGRPFALTVRGAACQDSMSGEKFPMTATLKVSGRTDPGCAGPASAEVAAAVAAVKAPAPAAPRAAAPKPASPRPAAPKPAVTPAAAPAPAPAPTEAPAAASQTEPATPAGDSTTVPAPALQLPSTPPAVTPAADAAAEPAAPADAGAAGQ
ncbi:COG3650 family protein [Paracoccus marinaquae]|uniref:Uncharacterized protein n=1 Tax=Paracoccus marinaquae TaxID=2841926 RepID=A0ABS6AHX2_9RHOB|nr:hypothetical protein [Paracoccus marinaquae]MBU3030200.1 hypothetical protein [Paracoccus marinaquae]